MKTLIVYYSRTGNTRSAARALSQALARYGGPSMPEEHSGSDIDEISDTVNRDGVMGYLSAGRDATFKRTTEIEYAADYNVGDYDLVLIGTPVWAFTMAPAIRTWLSIHGPEVKKAAFFCTMGGSGDKRTFEHMQELLGQAPLATLSLIDKDIRRGSLGAIDNFAQQLLASEHKST